LNSPFQGATGQENRAGLGRRNRIGEDAIVLSKVMTLFTESDAALSTHRVVSFAVCAWLSSWPQVGAGAAEDPAELDNTLVIEAGAAGERSVHGVTSSFGATAAMEVTPIEEWLEIELGGTALLAAGHTELSSDLVFKKPFRLSPASEFMIGLGPTLGRTLNGRDRGTAHGIEVVLDFMFWHSQHSGWYIEPSWSKNAGSDERYIGLNGGLLFGWH
jgi:hypothetical protein